MVHKMFRREFGLMPGVGCRHLLKSDSVFASFAARRGELFPEEMFADLFPSRRGRPSGPAEVMASVIT